MKGIIAKDTGGSDKDFTPISAGTHPAVCVWIFDVGTHETQWQNEPPKMKQKVIITWEVPSERIEIDGEDLPRVISHTYNLSLHENATLCQHLEGFRGAKFTPAEKQGFDLCNVLGHSCLLNITHNESQGKTYANIATISPLMKGMDKLKPETPLRWYSTAMGEDIPEGTPKWIIEKIKESVEYQHFHGMKNQADEDNIPPMSDEDMQGMAEDNEIPF